MDEPIRVMIVDDHAVLRSASTRDRTREGTRGRRGGRHRRGRPSLVRAPAAEPRVDGSRDAGDRGDRRSGLHELHPDVSVLVLSMHGEADDVRRAFEAGASGYVPKTAADEELIRAIRAVSNGERYLHPSLGAVLAQPPQSRGAVDELSSREREVLRLLALGHTNQEIDEQLYVSVRTVESHRAHIMTKLRAASRAEMVQHAIAGGLLEDEA